MVPRAASSDGDGRSGSGEPIVVLAISEACVP